MKGSGAGQQPDHNLHNWREIDMREQLGGEYRRKEGYNAVS